MVKEEFPNEEILTLKDEPKKQNQNESWSMFFDGASNIMGHGIGAILMSSQGKHISVTTRLDFECTNNMAEYEACILGLQAALDNKVTKLEVYDDSTLVIYQLRDEWETKDYKLIPYQAYVQDLMSQFESINFEHTPREGNQLADALATLSSMFAIKEGGEILVIRIKRHETQAHCCTLEEKEDAHSWYFDINKYIKEGKYPVGASDNDKKIIRRRLSDSYYMRTSCTRRILIPSC
ncbi:uncharacterized protein LOC109793995 [Cajanus cajan]|uniref:uncharacterized protein LOC109793995 n=1 Tax=Cajanus cajan TaxID=3821 RepID=UPI00098D91E5|nr:uncharacterized protein LOC109793995 [Cajanus cajan]